MVQLVKVYLCLICVLPEIAMIHSYPPYLISDLFTFLFCSIFANSIQTGWFSYSQYKKNNCKKKIIKDFISYNGTNFAISRVNMSPALISIERPLQSSFKCTQSLFILVLDARSLNINS